VEDYLQIHFELGPSLSIFNTVALTGPVAEDLAAINGKRLLIADESAEKATLRFEDESVIEVDLRDEAFNGPEAMTLHLPGEPIVVWN
jgi:hypothetical protein